MGGLLRGMMAGGGGAPGDPDFANVVSLFNGTGQPNGTTFTDAKSKIWTPYGGAQVLSGQAEFDGVDAYVSTPSSVDFAFDDGDFCVEMFVTADDVAGNHVMIGKRNLAGFTPFGIGIFGSKLQMLVSVTGLSWEATVADPSDFPVGTEQHVGLERVGDTLYLLRNGAVVASHVIGTDAVMASSDNLVIGTWEITTFPFDGRIRSWRITKGANRYGGSSYTPPGAPFPDA